VRVTEGAPPFETKVDGKARLCVVGKAPLLAAIFVAPRAEEEERPLSDRLLEEDAAGEGEREGGRAVGGWGRVVLALTEGGARGRLVAEAAGGAAGAAGGVVALTPRPSPLPHSHCSKGRTKSFVMVLSMQPSMYPSSVLSSQAQMTPSPE